MKRKGRICSFSLFFIASICSLSYPCRSQSLDIDSDFRSELAVFRGGALRVATLLGAVSVSNCGGPGMIPAPGNYLRDVSARIAVWNPSFGLWHVCTDTLSLVQPWGIPGDIPVAADYNGDSITDYAVYRPGTHEWFVLFNSGGLTPGSTRVVELGGRGVPVPADYDGDGKADIGFFHRERESGGARWEWESSLSRERRSVTFGLFGDVPVPADFNGDGKAELAVWRPWNGTWYVFDSGETRSQQFGLQGDVASPVDYDGDGSADFVVYRPAESKWYILASADSGAKPLFLSLGRRGDRVANHGRVAVVDRRAPGDFDGDRASDLVVTRKNAEGRLEFFFGTGSANAHPLGRLVFGRAGDIVVPGDYDGDGVSDLGVANSSGSLIEWRFRLSSEQGDTPRERIVFFGLPGDELLPADYDGDGKSDIGVVRNMADGSKLWLPSNSTASAVIPVSWGFSDDTALTADVDGDGKSDYVVIRKVGGELMWLVRTANGRALEPRLYGFSSDEPFLGDYDGDGRAEIGVLRKVNGLWMVIIDGLEPFYWGFESDVPLGGIYTGDGRYSRAVWRVVGGQGYFFLNARPGGSAVVPLGVIGDLPLNPSGATATENGSASNENGGGGSGKRLDCATRTGVSEQERGFVWKPISDSDSKLVVLFGRSRVGDIKAVALVESLPGGDVVLETLRYVGNTNGGRPTFRAKRRGADYPSGVILVRQDRKGAVHCIDVPNPGSRAAS